LGFEAQPNLQIYIIKSLFLNYCPSLRDAPRTDRLRQRQPMRDLIPSDRDPVLRAFLQYRGVCHHLPQFPPPAPIFPCHFDWELRCYRQQLHHHLLLLDRHHPQRRLLNLHLINEFVRGSIIDITYLE
jgi:hypothetical protein